MHDVTNRWASTGGYREVLVIAVPLILSTSAWSVQHFVDRMFLSWYSPETLAASMPAGILFFTLMSLFIGTASYVSTFVAQYYGAERYQRIGPALWQGIYISLLGGLLLLCLIPFAQPIFGLVGHDPAVQHHEVVYFRILCIGGFPVIASAAISGFFAGRGRPWPVMWVNTLSTAVNLIMDYALIFGAWGFPELGIKGAGIATVLAGCSPFLPTSSSYPGEPTTKPFIR
jgi:MATE family multidrug resistance protein